LSLKQQMKAVRLTPLTCDGTPLGDRSGLTIGSSCIKSVGFDDDQVLLDHAGSGQSG